MCDDWHHDVCSVFHIITKLGLNISLLLSLESAILYWCIAILVSKASCKSRVQHDEMQLWGDDDDDDDDDNDDGM